MQKAYEVLGNEQKRRDYDTYKGRSYYENQYSRAHEEEKNEGPYEKYQKENHNKESYRTKYSAYEWYHVSPSLIIFWGFVGVVSSNHYE